VAGPVVVEVLLHDECVQEKGISPKVGWLSV
jgi:hypothetical protein